MEEFADRPGLILDLRFNSGGSEPVARNFAGCFVREKAMYAKHANILPGDESGSFGPPGERWIEPTPDRPAYRGKVAVVTGPAIMSSAEAFLLMMKQAPDSMLIGLPSYGSSGNPKPHTLPNGVTVYLPSWKAMRPGGTPFETEGIAPGIRIEAPLKDGDFETGDPVLQAAVEWLRK